MTAPHDVPQAHGATITAPVLAQVAEIARKIERNEPLTEADGALVMLTLGPLVAELRARRTAMARIGEMAAHDAGNVIPFHGA